MRKYVGLLILACVCLAAGATVLVGQSPVSVSWAYGYVTDSAEPVPPPCPADALPHACSRPGRKWTETDVLRLPDTSVAPTVEQVQSYYDPADWYPNEHPAAPAIVQHGREKDRLRSCAHCHYHNGMGKPENGHVAGLPVQYFVQQMALFKSGGRKSADPRKANHNEMIQIARFLTDAEITAAAEYYAGMKWRPWVKVIESATAPRTRQSPAGLFVPLAGNETEALGQRIIEVPEFPERTEVYRDPHAGFVAYVPVGSVARGKELVTTGGGKTTACTTCHGPELQGAGNVPPIADRTASYAMRQLYNYQQGTRQSAIMQPLVSKLTTEDIIAIVAYLASL
jgi:cytochrome c553